MSSENKDAVKVIADEVAKADKSKLHHAKTVESDPLAVIKTQAAIAKGVPLKHAETQGEGLTEAQKKAFLEDQAEKNKA